MYIKYQMNIPPYALATSQSIILVSERVSLEIDTLHVLERNGWGHSHPRYSEHSTLVISYMGTAYFSGLNFAGTMHTHDCLMFTRFIKLDLYIGVLIVFLTTILAVSWPLTDLVPLWWEKVDSNRVRSLTKILLCVKSLFKVINPQCTDF